MNKKILLNWFLLVIGFVLCFLFLVQMFYALFNDGRIIVNFNHFNELHVEIGLMFFLSILYLIGLKNKYEEL